MFFQKLKENFEGIQKALTKEIKEMKDVFEELEAELSKEVFSVAMNSKLNVARFTEMHVSNTIVEARCLELKAELSNLRDKSHNNNHDELVNRFSNLEVNHLNLQLKYQNLKDSLGNNPPTPDKDTSDFDSIFVIGKMTASLQGKDNVIRQLKKKISHLASTASSSIPSIYIQQFWDIVRYDKTAGCYKCQLDEQWYDLTKDTLKDALQITPINNNKEFSSPPSSDALINFVNALGYPKLVKNLSNVLNNDMFQSWRALTTIINLCLMGKTSGFERPRALVLLILWGIVNRAHRDYVGRIWEEFTQSIPTFIEDKKNLAQHTYEKKKSYCYCDPDAKGTKREVFGMPILGNLIIADIQGESYYQEDLAKVAKHQRNLTGETVSDPDSPVPKPTKTTKKAKPSAPEAYLRPPVSKPVLSQQPEPKPAPAKYQGKKRKLVTEIFDKPFPARKSKPGLVSKRRKPFSSLRSIDESVAKGIPEKEPRDDDEEADVQRALEERLKSIYDASRGPLPPVVIREPKSGKYQLLPEVQGKGKAKATSIPTGSSGPDESSLLYAELRLTNSKVEFDEDVPGIDARVQGFTATAYTKVQENLKLTVEEQVILKEPARSFGTLSSLQHLMKDLSFATKSNNRNNNNNNNKTIHSPPSQSQKSTIDSMLMKRIGELEHIMAYLIQENKHLEERLDNHVAPLEMSMNRDHSEELAKDLAKARKKKKKIRDSPKTPPGSQPNQPPPLPPTGPFGASRSLGASGSSTRGVTVSNQGRMIHELDKDEGAELMNEKEEKETEEVQDITGNAQVEERQAKIYQIDMDHAGKVLTAVPAATVTPAPVKVVVPSTRRRKGVIIRDPEEESSAKTPTKTKSKDKGKGIVVEEPKPMKKKRQVELDEAYARKLQEELNQDIDWEVAMDHVKQKAKEKPYVQRYQVMKKIPQTEAQARRNMMMYLKNTAGFRMDYFKGMSYDDIRPIFEAKFNSNIKLLQKSKEQMEEEENRAIASINETPALKAAKRRRLNEEAKDVEELKQHLEIVPDEDDDVYTEATPLARKVPVVDYQIVHFNNKPHYKIIRADETHQLYAKVKSWKLLESCRVHIVALTTTQLIMLVERRYPLSRMYSVATNSELNIARFTEIHVANTIVEARCLELEAELSNLRDKSHNDNHDELVNRFSNLEKVFANMKRVGTGISGDITPLFDTMMVQAVEEVDNLPTVVQDIPIPDVPSSSQPQRKHKPRRKERKETEVSLIKLHTEDHVPTTSDDLLPSAFKETVVDKEKSSKQGRKIVDIDANAEVNLENVYNLDMAHEEIVLSVQDVTDADEVAKEMVEVITTAKIIIDEVSTAGGELNAANEEPVSVALTNTTTAQPSEATKTTVDITTAPKAKGIVLHDMENSTTRIASSKS
nr:hypothetical protein [Tanacetum cinerariifolium]